MNNIATIALAFLFFFASCMNGNEQKQKELELKEKELSLRERELALKEKESTVLASNSETASRFNKHAKANLRYLFFANGGIIGYFDNGTYVGCPRCDFCKSNIASMFNATPTGTYSIEVDGSLLRNGSEKEFPSYNTGDMDGSALINYHWYIKPPQY
jgi:hypothetical protein